MVANTVTFGLASQVGKSKWSGVGVGDGVGVRVGRGVDDGLVVTVGSGVTLGDGFGVGVRVGSRFGVMVWVGRVGVEVAAAATAVFSTGEGGGVATRPQATIITTPNKATPQPRLSMAKSFCGIITNCAILDNGLPQ